MAGSSWCQQTVFFPGSLQTLTNTRKTVASEHFMRSQSKSNSKSKTTSSWKIREKVDVHLVLHGKGDDIISYLNNRVCMYTHTHTHSLVKKQAMEVQQPDASTWEAVTTEFG